MEGILTKGEDMTVEEIRRAVLAEFDLYEDTYEGRREALQSVADRLDIPRSAVKKAYIIHG